MLRFNKLIEKNSKNGRIGTLEAQTKQVISVLNTTKKCSKAKNNDYIATYIVNFTIKTNRLMSSRKSHSYEII